MTIYYSFLVIPIYNLVDKITAFSHRAIKRLTIP